MKELKIVEIKRVLTHAKFPERILTPENLRKFEGIILELEEAGVEDPYLIIIERFLEHLKN